MKNNLSDLNNILMGQLEALSDDELTANDAELERQLKKADAMSKIARNVMQVAQLQLNAIKISEQCGIGNNDMPALVMVKDSRNEEEQRTLRIEQLKNKG